VILGVALPIKKVDKGSQHGPGEDKYLSAVHCATVPTE
jgi:hypothetical protein